MSSTNNNPLTPFPLTKGGQRGCIKGEHSFGFIVPFLNQATWLSCFIAHYLPILASNPKNKMVFVEGATSFHSSAEHRSGLSIDRGADIIKKLRTPQIMHIPKGRVGTLAELLSEGFIHCNAQDYIIPLCASDFISEEFFHSKHTNVDAIHITKAELVGDFRHCAGSKPFIVFKNIEGLLFRQNDMVPYWDNIRLDIIGKMIYSDVPMVSTEKIETKYQFNQRIGREKRYTKWYHNSVNPTMIWDETYLEKEKNQRVEESGLLSAFMESVLYLEYFPEVLKTHEWYNKGKDDIWNYNIVYPNFIDRSSIPSTEYKILEIGCATGKTLTYYKERGWKAIGIEPSLWASGYGRHLLNVNVRTGVATDYSFQEGEFAIIAFWDSFEHVPNPIETLQHIKPWLADDGKLMIYTPDVSKFEDDKRHFLWSPGQHFFLYTPASLRTLLEKIGFKVISVDKKIDNHGFLMVAKRSV